jgi:hypothetical protein
VLESAKAVLLSQDIHDMLKEKDEDGSNILAFATQHSSTKTVEEILKVLPNWLSDEEISDMMFNVETDGNHCLHRAASFSSPEVYRALMAFAKTHVTEDKQRELLKLKGSKNKNIFLLAASNEFFHETIAAVLESAKAVLLSQDIHEMLKEKDEDGSNILAYANVHGSAKTYDEILKILPNWFSDSDISDV